MLKILIVDNELPVRGALREMIQLVSHQPFLIEEADGVLSGLKMIDSFKPDILFLDIQMDDGSGFDLLQQVPQPAFQLIFTTAFDNYAIRAFQFSALDYLLKPIDPAALQKSLERAITQLNQAGLNRQLSVLLQQVSAPLSADKKIVLKDNSAAYYVKVADIFYCQAEGTYTRFSVANMPPVMVSRNLKEFETLLEPLGFLRTHHSYLVNTATIRRFDKADGGSLVLDNGDRIPVSQRKRDFVLAMLEKSSFQGQ